ncbi:hypothetical protein GX51_05182 [Blastomyces parvus]|uniref:Uncharacterized protein n=1 Tax=Blastomyces parvus TaxID=2060905 RepID=A0A2B7WXU1_9EURO|nr:hypothetical protein GX51_05182 [Blastomyces parvus]
MAVTEDCHVVDFHAFHSWKLAEFPSIVRTRTFDAVFQTPRLGFMVNDQGLKAKLPVTCRIKVISGGSFRDNDGTTMSVDSLAARSQGEVVWRLILNWAVTAQARRK